MDISMFITGIGIGFLMAAPFGPIGVLCMRRILTNNPTSGLISGLGAATADALCSAIAGFGLTFVSSSILSHQIMIRLLGGLFLCVLGAKTFIAKPCNPIANVKTSSLISVYTSTFFLTMANPITTLSFAAIFAGLGITETDSDYVAASALILGVFLGSASWWLALSSSIKIFKLNIDFTAQKWINKLSGGILTIFGLLALLSLHF